MEKRYVENFKQLIQDLKDTPEAAFNMHAWGKVNPIPECGTTSCALGRAAMQPWANKQGVEMRHVWDNRDLSIEKASEECLENPRNWKARFFLKGKKTTPQIIAKRLFGIKNGLDFIYLFTNSVAIERTLKQQIEYMENWISKQTQTT